MVARHSNQHALAVPVLISGLVFWRSAAERSRSAGAIWWWNALGIADLSIATGPGFLTSPSVLQLGAFDHSSKLVAAFPLALIPSFLVSLSFLLHAVALIKLARATRAAKHPPRRGSAPYP